MNRRTFSYNCEKPAVQWKIFNEKCASLSHREWRETRSFVLSLNARNDGTLKTVLRLTINSNFGLKTVIYLECKYNFSGCFATKRMKFLITTTRWCWFETFINTFEIFSMILIEKYRGKRNWTKFSLLSRSFELIELRTEWNPEEHTGKPWPIYIYCFFSCF